MAYTFTIRCRASADHSLAIADGEVILTKADPSDDRQLWYKDMRYGGGLKDEAGSPAFALVNKATGDALNPSFGYNCPVQAIKFDPGYTDESILWAETEDLAGDGFRRIHMINNADYIFHADHATPWYGGARDGTRLVLFRWNGGENQFWQIARHTAAPGQTPPVRISCQSDQNLSLTVRDGAAVLAQTDPEDERQCWIQSFRSTGHVTDKEGHRAFALVNRATGKALRYARCDEPVEVVGHSLREGFHCVRDVSDTGLVRDAAEGVPEFGGAHDGTPIILFPWNGGPNRKRKMFPFY